MLRIILEFERIEDKVSAVSDYFDDVYDVSWFDTQLAKDIIMGIDLSKYIGDRCIDSPVLGMIPPERLSGGCKGCLILLNRPHLVVRGECFGDNCFEWLNKIGEQQDITITLHHFLRNREIPLNAIIVNDGSAVTVSGDINRAILRVGGTCNVG